MRIVKRLVVLSICSSFLAVPLCVPQEKVDLDMISRIRYEGFRNSKVMEMASGLMDQIGARLTGSPNMKRANDWTLAKLKEFGLVNAHLEECGPFGPVAGRMSMSTSAWFPRTLPHSLPTPRPGLRGRMVRSEARWCG
jgi:hypothetical protein